MKLPNSVNIFNKTYTVTYCKNPSEVDIHHRESCWGQTDFWTQSIRIYKGTNNVDDVIHTLIHEIIHAIANELHIKVGDEYLNSANDDVIDQLALGILNVFKANKFDFSK